MRVIREATMEDEKYLFIDDLPAFLLAQTGLRLSLPTLHKMTSPGVGLGPPSAGHWGKRQVFRPSDVLEWARARVRPEKSALGPKKMPATKAGKKVIHDNEGHTRTGQLEQ
jgi:hypothetical protein